MLELERVTKRFRGGITAVDDVSLSLSHGVLGLLGPNGAGKTSLMQMIATITAPTAGTIRFDGVDLASDPITCGAGWGTCPRTSASMTISRHSSSSPILPRSRESPTAAG